MDNSNNFEKQLLNDGYSKELIKAILAAELPNCSNERHKKAKKKEIEAYDVAAIESEISNHKTKYAAPIAEEIIKCSPPKDIPLVIRKLFDEIKKNIG